MNVPGTPGTLLGRPETEPGEALLIELIIKETLLSNTFNRLRQIVKTLNRDNSRLITMRFQLAIQHWK